jgi:hypothetical protein
MRKIISFAASFVNTDSTSPVAENAKPDRAVTVSGGSVAARIGYT